MTPRVVGRALLAPLRRLELLLAGAAFWLLLSIGLLLRDALAGTLPAVGYIGLLMVWLIVLPALAGYLLGVIDALGGRLPAPVPDTDLFLPAGSGRSLFTVVVVVALLSPRWLWPESTAVGLAVLLAAGMLLPMHWLLLATTASRIGSINPLALARLYRRLWPHWLWLPLLLAPVAGLWRLAAGLSDYLQFALAVYLALAAACLSGRLLAVLDVAAETDIGPPLEPDAAERAGALERDRTAVLNHAYGLASRGNRDGGFAHLEAHADASADPAGTATWFFHAMQRWDLGDAPLFYGQRLLHRLLDAGDDRAAMKVFASCLYRNESFRPADADRERLIGAAERLGREDLLAALRR